MPEIVYILDQPGILIPISDVIWALVFQKKGIRAKLLTEDGNEIDTMFVDRRNDTRYPNGNILVGYVYIMS